MQLLTTTYFYLLINDNRLASCISISFPCSNIAFLLYKKRHRKGFQYRLIFVHLWNSKWTKTIFHICLWLHSQIHAQNPTDSSARFTASNYCQILTRDGLLYLSIRRTRKLWFLVSPTVLILAAHEKLSYVTHLKRELFPPKILLAYARKGSRPHQLPPNSCTLIQDPKCHTLSWDCWVFIEVCKYQRIFLFSIHCYKTTTADPSLTWFQEYPHLQFTFVHHLHWTTVFNWIYCGFYTTITFPWFKRNWTYMFWLPYNVSINLSLPSEFTFIHISTVALLFLYQDYCINHII